MIELHGQEKWDRSVAVQAEIDAAGGTQSQEDRTLSAEDLAAAQAAALAGVAPISAGLVTLLAVLGIILAMACGVDALADRRPLAIGAGGALLALLVDALLIGPLTSPGARFLIHALPFAMIFYGLRHSAGLLAQNEVVRVVFPPLVLIVAVLGSILGGITNPTPAAALGAAGAILLAAYRKQQESGKSGQGVLMSAFAIVIMLLFGVNFDLRVGLEDVAFENWVAYAVAMAAYTVAMGGIVYACAVLFAGRVLSPVVRETAKVTAMVFAILIGCQTLNLGVSSFGGEHYIQELLRSFEREWAVFLIVMLVLFILGFVLDFLEIIYIVVPIVGPVIYGGTMDPKWVTIMIAVNLQTSFLTPPFGFALFYLRGVAPASVNTMHIYRGVAPFVGIQVLGLLLLWLVPGVVTVVPSLLSGN